MADGEIITRNHLPHWYVPGAMHFITYRLAGTLPMHVIENLRARKAHLLRQKPDDLTLPAHRERVHKQLFAHYDRYLDQSHGRAWLAVPAVAAVIRKSLYYHDGGKYHLLAYCVMPNHVHVLLQPLEVALRPVSAEQEVQAATDKDGFGEVPDASSPLSSIMHSLKSYTANLANRLLHRAGAFWQHESYDHWVRDENELERIVDYIAANPVKAGLVKEPHEWFFCSAHDRFLADGAKCGWLPFS